MSAVELHAFEAGRCVVQDAGCGHKGEGAVGGEGGGLPAGGGGPGAADHVVGAAVGWLATGFGGMKLAGWRNGGLVRVHSHDLWGVGFGNRLWIGIAGEGQFRGIKLGQCSKRAIAG